MASFPTINQTNDVVLIGAGLANSLIALRLAELRPDLSLTVLESKPDVAVPQTWSFHGSDVLASDAAWTDELATCRWEGYEIAFPNLQRHCAGSYLSIKASDLRTRLKAKLGARLRFNSHIAAIGPTEVRLESGATVPGRMLIDGRGFGSSVPFRCGYQKFCGLHLRLAESHGLRYPLLMDARVPQVDGYRFIYLLPWSEREIFVEDTYYSDSPTLDVESLQQQIFAYTTQRGWVIADLLETETGTLPIPFAGAAPPNFQQGIAKSGVASGRFHATTGYSFGAAAALASEVAALKELNSAAADQINAESVGLWSRGNFFRQLNNMLFLAATPAERWRVMEKFYRQGDGLIARFYRGQLRPIDRIKLLSGKPPLPALPALRAFMTRFTGERPQHA